VDQEKASESSGRPDSGQFAARIAKLKAETVRHDRLTGWLLGGALIVCASIGLAIWFAEPALDRDNLHFGFAAGAAAMIFFLVALGGRLLLPKPEAICPKCGCDWNAESDNDQQRWMSWSCCPGCGLLICQEARRDEAPNSLQP